MGLGSTQIAFMLKRWWWLLVVIPILTTVIALAFGSTKPDQYASTSTLLVSSRPTEGVDFGTIQGSQQLAVTYEHLVHSWLILDAVIDELNLDMSIEQLDSSISSSVVSGTSLIEISVSNEDPEAASLISQKVGEIFREYVVEQSGSDGVTVGLAVPARVAVAPYAPRLPLYGMFGGTLGLLISAGVAGLLIFRANTSARTPRLDAYSDLQLLAKIPWIPQLRDGQRRLFFDRNVTADGDASLVALRDRIISEQQPGRPLKIAILGYSSDEGTSTLSANLALALSQLTETLLIDTDVKHPTLHQIFGFPNDAGITNLLENPNQSWRSCIRPLSSKLSLLSAGQTGRKGANLVGPEGIAAAIQSIDIVDGVIIVDCSWSDVTSKSPLIAWTCDLAIVVTRPATLRRGAIRKVVRSLHEPRVTLLGIVLNKYREQDWDIGREWDNRTAEADPIRKYNRLRIPPRRLLTAERSTDPQSHRESSAERAVST